MKGGLPSKGGLHVRFHWSETLRRVETEGTVRQTAKAAKWQRLQSGKSCEAVKTAKRHFGASGKALTDEFAVD